MDWLALEIQPCLTSIWSGQEASIPDEVMSPLGGLHPDFIGVGYEVQVNSIDLPAVQCYYSYGRYLVLLTGDNHGTYRKDEQECTIDD